MAFVDGSQKSLKLTLGAITLLLTACAGSPPDNLGIQDGRLAPCPSSPNCVSSFAADADHAVNPWPYTGTQQAAREKLVNLLENTENASVISNKPGYVRAEFESSLMGFVDDVEFMIEDQQIQMRSASRLGYSDLGANRSRIDSLRERFLPCCQ